MAEYFEPFELLYSTYIRNDTDQRIKVHAIYSGAVRCFERHYVIPVKETVELMEETYVWQGVERRFCISEITVEGPKRSYPKTTIPLARFISKPTKKCTFVVKMEQNTQNTHQHHGVHQSGGAMAAAVATTTATTAAASTAVTTGEVPTAAIQPINSQTNHQHQVDVTTATTATAVSDLGERPPPPPYDNNHDNNDDHVHNKDGVQQVSLPENPLPPLDESNTTNTTVPALNVSARPLEFNTASLQHSSPILNTSSTKKQYYFLFERACMVGREFSV